MAIANAGSRMMRRVSSDGHLRQSKHGQRVGQLAQVAPWAARPKPTASTVSTTTQIRGDGMAVSTGHASPSTQPRQP